MKTNRIVDNGDMTYKDMYISIIIAAVFRIERVTMKFIVIMESTVLPVGICINSELIAPLTAINESYPLKRGLL